MKKTFGRLILASLLIAVVLSVAAFAATTDYEPGNDGKYSIAYTNEMGAIEGNYYSMVVVEGIYAEGKKPVISEDTVLYMGQVTAGSAGATFADWTPKSDSPASVYVGKQGGDAVELIGYINNNMVKVYGTVSSSIPGGTKYEATITVQAADSTETNEIKSVGGKYEFFAEESKEYTIEYKMTNHTAVKETRTFTAATQSDKELNPEAKAAAFVYGDASYDYHGDGTADYVDLMIAANATNTGAGAAVKATYSYADGKITGTASDTQGFAVRQVLSIDKSIFNITDIKGAITLPAGAVEKYYNGTTNGTIVTVEVVYYNAAPSTNNIITIATPLAEGKTSDDFAYNTFSVDSVAYANGGYNYYKVSGQTDNVTVTNELLANVGTVKIDVKKGDTVSLQDGSTIKVEADGQQAVNKEKGYIGVNVGKASQRVYYIDPSATDPIHIHNNVAVSSDEMDLRDRTKTDDGKDLSGLRFKIAHNPLSRQENIDDHTAAHRVMELGFITTTGSKTVAGKLQEMGIDPNFITAEAAEGGAAVKGAAYDARTGVNYIFNNENDEAWDIRGVLYNIPITPGGVTTTVYTRPYYKIGGQYLYGETMVATLAEVASAIKSDAATWNSCSTSMKDYVNEVLAVVKDTDITTGETVIIDITDLFAQLGLVNA